MSNTQRSLLVSIVGGLLLAGQVASGTTSQAVNEDQFIAALPLMPELAFKGAFERSFQELGCTYDFSADAAIEAFAIRFASNFAAEAGYTGPITERSVEPVLEAADDLAEDMDARGELQRAPENSMIITLVDCE